MCACVRKFALYIHTYIVYHYTYSERSFLFGTVIYPVSYLAGVSLYMHITYVSIITVSAIFTKRKYSVYCVRV